MKVNDTYETTDNVYIDLLAEFQPNLLSVVKGKDPNLIEKVTDYLTIFNKDAKETLMPGQSFYQPKI